MICMIPKLNLGVGEMGSMIYDLHVFINNPSSQDTKSMDLLSLTLVCQVTPQILVIPVIL